MATAALIVAAGGAAAQAPSGAGTEVPEAMKRLATDDPQEQRARWGDLAAVAGKIWLHAAPGDVASVWRDAQWVVPGAVMRYQRGFCLAMQCQRTDYLVHYNAEAKQLEFFEKGEKAYTSRIQEDGSVRLVGTGIVGVLTAETLKFDAASNTFYSDKHELKASTEAQLGAVTRGFAGDARGTGAPGTAAEAQLRAELAQAKAQLEALRQQQAAAAAPIPAPPPAVRPPSAAQQKAAEQRARLEARLREADERKLQAEARAREAEHRAREEAQARIAAALQAKEESEARTAAAQRAAAQKAAAPSQPAAAVAPAAAAPAATAAAKPAAPTARTNACGGVDGVYGTGANYRIEVKFEGETLTVREPNRTSVYRHEGRCQYAFTHPTGVTYRMGVTPRALSAYKQDPASATPLALIQAHAAPQASGSCKAQEIPVQNPAALHPGMTRLFGLHAVAGVKVPGTYRAPEPDGHPWTELGAGGNGGVFEVYGAPKREYRYNIVRWYIQANCDGTPLRESFEAADRYFVIFQLDRPYTGLEWHRMQYIVRKGQDRVSIDDRAKGKME